MSDIQPVAPQSRGAAKALLWLVLLLVSGVVAWRGWSVWSAREHDRASEASQQWQALESRIDALRTDQRAQAQRLQQADATNRVLREELLGLDQRAALLEDSVRKLGDPERRGVQALRIDEVRMLLGQGEQRLRLAGDLDGARRAYALAASTLDTIDGTRLDSAGLLNVRQSLVQERAALDAPGADPRALAATRLDAFAASLSAPLPVTTSPAPGASWWQRAFARIVQVSPANRVAVLPGADRTAALAALQLELTLARAAVERRDESMFRVAVARADGWMTRLWPDSPQRRARRVQLQALGRLPLVLALPTLGSTRQQLQSLGGSR
ncbi:MAG: hypothetical protein JWL98_1235 [Xanthomonadaceae bacterium]|nr:hypothetical protein [Xanthomonadaceae bacterium]